MKRLASFFGVEVGDFYSFDSQQDLPWTPDNLSGIALSMTKDDLSMDRRGFIAAAAATILSGPELIQSLAPWLQPMETELGAKSKRRRLAQTDVDHLEIMAQEFRAWNRQYGGVMCRKAVIGLLQEVSSSLNDPQTSTVQIGLYRVMSHLSSTAASMSWDSNFQLLAQDYYRLALRASHAGEDRILGVNILANMARQMLSLERPQQAQELIQFARQSLPKETGPRVRAMLDTREAWSYAAMGQGHQFLELTHQAGETLGKAKSNEEPYWIQYFDEAELAGVTGGRLLDLARKQPTEYADLATQHITSAIDKRGAISRGHALDRIGLAECRFLAGDVSVATQLTHEALNVAEKTRSGRVRSHLKKLNKLISKHQEASVVEAKTRIEKLLSTEETS